MYLIPKKVACPLLSFIFLSHKVIGNYCLL